MGDLAVKTKEKPAADVGASLEMVLADPWFILGSVNRLPMVKPSNFSTEFACLFSIAGLIVANSPTPAAKRRTVGSRILKQDKVSKAATSELVAKARGGDAKARKKLVATYSYLPPHLAARYGASANQLPEAIKVGIEALHVAIDRYQLKDPEHFTIYVRRLIERRIQTYLKLKSRPAKVRKKRLSQYQQRLAAELELIRALGDKLKKRLTKQQYKVIRYRFGIAGRTRKTLTEIGLIMGVSRAWVHRLERQAIDRLL